MRADDIEEMRRLPLFNGVNQTLAESMLKVAYLQRFPAHVELVREGEPADFLHVIVDGHVEVFSAYRDRKRRWRCSARPQLHCGRCHS